MSLYCDPREVLFHLRLLGYENISEKHLKEFVTDLKRLIKYELKRSCQPKEESIVKNLNSSNHSSYVSSATDVSCVRLNAKAVLRRSCCGTGSSTNVSSSSFISDSIDLQCYPKRTEKVIDMDEKLGNYRSSQDKKPKSFIRSWKLNQPPADIRCDPVSLYHWYQQYWNKQKVPGEEPHKKLRWSVREKMLGDEPHPRPISQASGRSSRNIRK